MFFLHHHPTICGQLQVGTCVQMRQRIAILIMNPAAQLVVPTHAADLPIKSYRLQIKAVSSTHPPKNPRPSYLNADSITTGSADLQIQPRKKGLDPGVHVSPAPSYSSLHSQLRMETLRSGKFASLFPW